MMNHNFTAENLIEDQVGIAHDRKHANVGVVGPPSYQRKPFELTNCASDSCFNGDGSLWIAFPHIVGNLMKICDSTLSVAHLHPRKRA